MTANSSANAGSWLSAHGRLWYDDPLYRLAWIVWPQALGFLLFVVLWLAPPGLQHGAIPWAAPVNSVPAPQNPPAQPQIAFIPPTAPTQPVQQPQPFSDVLATCRNGNDSQIIQGCSAALNSGNLRGNDISEAYWRRGWAYYDNNQYQQAVTDYDRAISLDSDSPGLYADRGRIWQAMKNYDRALQDIDRALQLKPDYGSAYLYRGAVLTDLKRQDEALAAFNTAIQQDSTLFNAYYYRASIYEDRSNWRGVYDDGNQMIRLDPNNRFGYEFRGHAFMEVGQYQPAIADFSKAISLDSSQIYSYRLRGQTYFRLNQYDNAMADYQAALRIVPNDSGTIDYINELRRRQRGR